MIFEGPKCKGPGGRLPDAPDQPVRPYLFVYKIILGHDFEMVSAFFQGIHKNWSIIEAKTVWNSIWIDTFVYVSLEESPFCSGWCNTFTTSYTETTMLKVESETVEGLDRQLTYQSSITSLFVNRGLFILQKWLGITLKGSTGLCQKVKARPDSFELHSEGLL